MERLSFGVTFGFKTLPCRLLAGVTSSPEATPIVWESKYLPPMVVAWMQRKQQPEICQQKL